MIFAYVCVTICRSLFRLRAGFEGFFAYRFALFKARVWLMWITLASPWRITGSRWAERLETGRPAWPVYFLVRLMAFVWHFYHPRAGNPWNETAEGLEVTAASGRTPAPPTLVPE